MRNVHMLCKLAARGIEKVMEGATRIRKGSIQHVYSTAAPSVMLLYICLPFKCETVDHCMIDW